MRIRGSRIVRVLDHTYGIRPMVCYFIEGESGCRIMSGWNWLVEMKDAEVIHAAD